MKHAIITRVNLHMKLDTWKYPVEKMYEQPGWNENRIFMLNKFARKSLLNQDSNNFVYITLWHPGTVDKKGKLSNELQIEIVPTGDYDDEPLDYKALNEGTIGKRELNFSGQIRQRILSICPDESLITSLDCDDCLKFNFVSTLQDRVKQFNDGYSTGVPWFFDVVQRYCFDMRTGITGVKRRKTPSPFVSVQDQRPHSLGAVRWNHTDIMNRFTGEKVNGLYGLQVINGFNMFSENVGNECEVNLKEYGIYL